jgi:tRNA A-37 threonylcarbamoyl transferase component Bud32
VSFGLQDLVRDNLPVFVLPEIIARDKDRLRRFEQEAFAASALNHPNILTIYEFGVEGETHFLAAEFIDGETVRARLQHAPLALDEALDIAAQTAQALSAAHEAGIIHRYIKPENVMIRNDGIVKVLDFGLAKHVEPINRALAKKANERYTSAPALLADLKRLQKRLEFSAEFARDSPPSTSKKRRPKSTRLGPTNLWVKQREYLCERQGPGRPAPFLSGRSAG